MSNSYDYEGIEEYGTTASPLDIWDWLDYFDNTYYDVYDTGGGGGGGDSSSTTSTTNADTAYFDNMSQAQKDSFSAFLTAAEEQARLLASLATDFAQQSKFLEIADAMKAMGTAFTAGLISADIFAGDYVGAFRTAAEFVGELLLGVLGVGALESMAVVGVASALVDLHIFAVEDAAAKIQESYNGNLESFQDTNPDANIGDFWNEIFGISPYFGPISNNTTSEFVPNEYYSNYFDAGNVSFYFAPIVLDIDGDGIELVSKTDSTALFDIDGDGFREKLGWASADDGILVYDANENNKVDNYFEFSFVSYLEGAETDLEGLRAFDTNGDNILDANDDEFGKFKIWQDLNQNGQSEDGELVSLEQAGILSINLLGQASGEVNNGNVIMNTTTFERIDGTQGEVGDVFFDAYELGIQTKSFDNGTSIIQQENGITILNLNDNSENLEIIQSDSNSFEQVNVIQGNGGNDNISVIGELGILIDGGVGNDIISGGAGNDQLTGGAGSDIFVISNGHDIIKDFEAGIDTIQLDGLDSLSINDVLAGAEQIGDNVILHFSNDNDVILENLLVEDLTEDSFNILAG